MTDADARAAVLAEIEKLPKPVTVQQIASAAAAVLTPDRLFQFNQWLEKEGDSLCERINREKT